MVFFGKGYLKVHKASLQFLPEKHTDFIFTLFLKSLVFRIYTIDATIHFINQSNNKYSFSVRDYFAKLYCFGFASAIFIYAI